MRSKSTSSHRDRRPAPAALPGHHSDARGAERTGGRDLPAPSLVVLAPVVIALVVIALVVLLASAVTAGEPALVAVPHPDLRALEATVRDQLVEVQTAVNQVEGSEKLAAAYGELGRTYHAYGFHTAAAACYQNAEILAPETFDWLYLRAVVYQFQGNFEKAATTFERALALRPDDLPSLVHLAETELELERPETAERHLRRALEVNPGCSVCKASLGEIALAEGDHAEAVTLLSAALAEVPAATRLHHPLGMAYRGLGEMDLAREHLSQRGETGVTITDPLVAALVDLKEGERVRLLRGRQAFNAKDFATAVREFSAAVEADPKSVRARVNLSAALAKVGQNERALAELRRAIELEPSNPTAHYNLGSLLSFLGQFDEAAKHFEEVARLLPSDAIVRNELGSLERRRGRSEAALAWYAEAARLNSGNEDARYYEAVVLAELRRFTEALEKLRTAVTDFPRSERIAFSLARLLAACPDRAVRDGGEALEIAQKLYERSKTVANATLVAESLAELDRCSEAADWQRRVVAAVENGDQADLEARARRDLARYQTGPPCR